jgi:cation diffusion facilitator family transporter
MRSRPFIYISLVVDICIAASKFVAAAFTGSSSMISEGIHSVIDASSQLLLIWGVRISRKRPDEARPFGYGRELYFWSFIVSLVIFVMGGCISFYEGLLRFRRPEFSGNANWNYGILATAFIFTTVSMVSALKTFNKQRRDGDGFWHAVTESKDPSVFIVLLGDIGDMAGLIVAFFGVFLGRYFKDPHYDGAASMVIGAILIAISYVLIRESKSLLMGEPTNRKLIRRVLALAEADEAVVKIKKQYNIYLAPEEIVLQLNTVFKPSLKTEEITTAIERITKKIQEQFPRFRQIFIEPVRK